MSTLDRLALAVLQPGFVGTTLPDPLARLLEQGLGGVCLFDANTHAGPEALTALCGAIHAAHPDAVVAVDEEGGDVTRLHTATGSPFLAAAALGHLDDLAATRATGAGIGRELAASDLDLVLGPVADVNSNPDNPVIGTRSFGSDRDLAARHVAAWVEGAESSGVAACLKHYPGHGDTHLDSHVDLPVVATAEPEPFRAGIAAGARAVMTSHIVVTDLDADRPATFSPVVLRTLREELGFAGAVVTDALDMAGASAARGIPEAAVLALAAGADVLSLGPATPTDLVLETRAALVLAVRDGRVPEERLVEAAGRVPSLRRRQPTASAGPVDPSAGPRSLVVEGELPDLTGALVVTLETPVSAAIGDVPRGIRADHDGLVVDGRPLVVQVRDLHRHPAREAQVRSAAERVPVVVVDYGWPGPFDLPAARIVTHGGSLPAYAAVEALLREHGWSG